MYSKKVIKFLKFLNNITTDLILALLNVQFFQNVHEPFNTIRDSNKYAKQLLPLLESNSFV